MKQNPGGKGWGWSILFGFIAGGAFTVSLAGHFLLLWLRTPNIRILILVTLTLILGAGCVFLIHNWILIRLKQFTASEIALRGFLALGIAAVLFMNFVDYPPGVVVREHFLEFMAKPAVNSASSGDDAQFLEAQLDGKKLTIYELVCKGQKEKTGVLATISTNQNPVKCSFFARGGEKMEIIFADGPKMGLVNVGLDGESIANPAWIDLYNPQPGYQVVDAKIPSFPYKNPVIGLDVVAIALSAFLILISMGLLEKQAQRVFVPLVYLIAGLMITSNLVVFPTMPFASKLLFQPANGMEQFVHNSTDSEEINLSFAFYPYLREKSLIISPEILIRAGWIKTLSENKNYLKTLLNLKSLDFSKYPIDLTPEEAVKLMALGHEEWNRLSHGKYILVIGQNENEENYIFKLYGGDVWIVPVPLLSK